MRELRLSGAKWRDREDAYRDLLAALQAPPWHGHNLDALNDSIGAGSINGIEVPYRIVIEEEAAAGAEARDFIEKFASLIGDLANKGCPVELHRN